MNPIRVLQIVTYMGRGGIETTLMNYYRHMNRSQVQFDFLVHREFRADYDDEIESLGGKIYRLPRLVPWSPSYLKALNNFFDEHSEYKIIHVHQDCLSSVILKAAAAHRVPVRIAHSHSSNQNKNLKYPIKRYYKRQIAQYATDLFACGKDAGNWMFSGKPFTVMSNAIDTVKFKFNENVRKQVRKDLSIPDGALVIGHVGSFWPPKNHTYLVDIFYNLFQRNPSAVLLLVGDGGLRPAIQEKVKHLGLEKHVQFLGMRSDIYKVMQAMDVFVMPSLYEGLPVTMVEAQASGLPCFISDKVPIECKMTDAVTQIPLDASPEVWTEQILSAQNMVRKNMYSEIAAAGFDIAENAKWLQNYYIEHWKVNE